MIVKSWVDYSLHLVLELDPFLITKYNYDTLSGKIHQWNIEMDFVFPVGFQVLWFSCGVRPMDGWEGRWGPWRMGMSREGWWGPWTGGKGGEAHGGWVCAGKGGETHEGWGCPGKVGETHGRVGRVVRPMEDGDVQGRVVGPMEDGDIQGRVVRPMDVWEGWWG